MIKNFKNQKAFTLIELLVVVAIIGILSGVVLASLNSARKKGQIASIKSNLKNMIAQAELAYDTPGNYSTVCTNPGIVQMLSAITSAGGTASCYSHTQTGDVYQRWGISAKLNSDTTKNYSVDQNGVVTWDTTNPAGSSMTWTAADTACVNFGGRLPTLEELKSFWNVYGAMPPSFSDGNYWSSSILSSSPSNAYGVNSSTGIVFNSTKTQINLVRCVR